MQIGARFTGIARTVFAGFLILALPVPAFAKAGPQSFADLAEKLLPAVVNISTSQTVNPKDEDSSSGGSSGGDDQPTPDMQIPPGSPFEDFFKDYMQKHGQEMPQAHRHRATALGSGFIIDPSGYIVTNNHVIEDADEINVILQDDTNLTATLVGRDKKIPRSPCQRSVSATATKSASATGFSLSAIRMVWAALLLRASFPRARAISIPAPMMNICRPMRRSIAAIRAARCSTWMATLSA
jgi:hypothetical protein